MKTIFYDCEIIKCIPDRTGFRKPGFEYCQGWRDFPNMGISCIGYSGSVGEADRPQYRAFSETGSFPPLNEKAIAPER